MNVSGLEFTQHQIADTVTTLLLVFFAVPVPGYIQLHTGVSAVKISVMVVLLYLVVHLIWVHYSHHHA
jgi:hypothetical protein